MPPREWTMAKAQFAVMFGERFIKGHGGVMFNRPPTHGNPDSPHASLGLLPLGQYPVGSGRVEPQSLLHFHRERTKLVYRKECLVSRKA